MSHKQRKIEIATPDDVEKYASGGTAGSASSPPSPAAASAAGGSPAGAAASGEASSAGGPPSPEVEALRAEVEQWKDKTLRAKAELANYQRRSNQERAEAIKYANAGFAKALLLVVDDLERALSHVGTAAADGDAVAHALKLIYDNFVKVLKEHGVEPVEAAPGMPFDPTHQQALMQRPSDEYAEPTVLEVFQKGYRLHERVLRPAQVAVSRPPEKPASEGAESQAGESGA